MGVRKAVLLLISVSFICLAGCGNNNTLVTEQDTSTVQESSLDTSDLAMTSETEKEDAEIENIDVAELKETMVMSIDGTAVPVTWKDNDSVKELRDLAKTGLEISMSMYGGFEQVGSIGSSIARDDKQTTTEPGDIVLYSGNQLVVFYGSNSWAYTKLGKIELFEDELTNILSNGDVTITLSVEKEESEK